MRAPREGTHDGVWNPSPHGTNMGRTRRILLTLLLGFAVGCGTEAPQSDSDGGPILLDTGETPDAEEDTTAVLTACEANLDCAGGEVCRDGLCREACEASTDPCGGALEVCDPELEYCVECVEDADCDPDWTCLDRVCEPACAVDDDCDTGEVCDPATGTCGPPECAGDEDCQGGYRCTDGLCEPIDEPICAPGVSWCESDETIARCSVDGTAVTREACPPDSVCRDGDGDPLCATGPCADSAVGCLDEQRAYVCDETGAAYEEIECSPEEECDSGTCVPRPCVPGSVVCEGDAVSTCAGDGTGWRTEECGGTNACRDSEFGCACSGGGCVIRVCEPETVICSDNAVLRCSETGLRYHDPVPCPSDRICVAGECLPRECEPGSRACFEDNLMICASDGGTRTVVDCAAESRICVASDEGSNCVELICEPATVSCSAAGHIRLRCDERGAAEAVDPCPEGTRCFEGDCIEGECGEEVCNGIDDDCDGLIDDGLSCSEEGCPVGMQHVEIDDAEFCIDTYEASRDDATAESMGADLGVARSRVSVMPWGSATLTQATTACAAADKRLCSALEWQAACEGPAVTLYPYGNAYRSSACNGSNVPPLDRALPTGQFLDCVSPLGIFDQSGNVAEWTADGNLRGGGYDAPQLQLRCAGRFSPSVDHTPGPSYGFRCCADP